MSCALDIFQFHLIEAAASVADDANFEVIVSLGESLEVFKFHAVLLDLRLVVGLDDILP